MISLFQKLLRHLLGIRECQKCGVLAVRENMGSVSISSFKDNKTTYGNTCKRCHSPAFIYNENHKAEERYRNPEK